MTFDGHGGSFEWGRGRAEMARVGSPSLPEVVADFQAADGDWSAKRHKRCIVHVVAAPEFARLMLLNDLKRIRDFDHVVVCGPGPDAKAVEQEGFRVHTLPIRRKLAPIADLVTVVGLVGLIRRLRPDIVHTLTPKAGLLGQMAAALSGVRRRVHSCRGLLYLPGMARWRRQLYRITDRVTMALADQVLFVSDADREYCVREHLCRPMAAVHTGNGVDLSRFAAPTSPTIRHRARERLGLTDEHVIVLSVGRFVRDKGYVELADVAERLAPRMPALRFVWVAPVMADEDDVIPASLLQRRAIAQAVIRLDRQEDIENLYAAADLLVHASHREGVPRVLMEAAACGLPIVASRIPGNLEVIPDEDFGWLFAAGDRDGIEGAIRASIACPSERARRAERARRRTRAVFDQDRASERVGAIFATLTGRSAP